MTFIYVLVTAVIGLLFAGYLKMKISKEPTGSEKMQEISAAIREGAMAFLFREYRVIAIFIVVIVIIFSLTLKSGGYTSIAFVVGAIFSALAGFGGMRVATEANVRTAQAARKLLGDALRIAFFSGAVMGLLVVSLGLLGLVIVYNFLVNIAGVDAALKIITGFGFGASSIALFARVGGGIYTKAADVGADLVGKVEAGIPEDDPRNPATIADNVGDNVGDVAGMGGDLFESYVGSIIAAMVLGYVSFGMGGIYLPLAVSGTGIICSIIGTFFVKTNDEKKIQFALQTGLIIASILMIIASWFICNKFIPENPDISAIGVFFTIITGLVSGVLIGLITEYFTSANYSPVKKLAESSQTGAATTIINGLGLGYISTSIPIIIICIAIGISFALSGLFGIAVAAVGMLSTLGISLAIDAYGPVADNAGGIAEMAELGKEVRARTDALDSAGNTTAAIGKGFAIGSAALTALALFSAFSETAQGISLDLTEPRVIIGLLIGGCLPFIFSALTMKAVGAAAFDMIEEVRRQFKEIPGIMEGTGKPDYAKCVDIATIGAIKKMIAPAIMAIAVPLFVGYSLGNNALGGLLAGALVTGVLMAISMANSGGAWDNAKKYIETGQLGGKGSDTHKAAVVGDTVGDPFKDTSGPSINILIKLMTMISLIFATAFTANGLF
ncbi:sodium-translocating pyrophosphatase [candidate division KSB1 bacterium]